MRKLLVALALVCVAGVAQADVISDEPAAILIWPDVLVDSDDGDITTDTIFQIANTSLEPISAHCFHENANNHCSNTGQICHFASDCCSPSENCGTCDPGWLETDFRIFLTPRQPLGWVASEGMARDDVPLDGGNGGTGIGGASNAGTNIPRVPEVPYNGVLRCIATNSDGTPSDRNVLKGESTRLSELFALDDDAYTVAKHNAIGLKAIEGAVNDDRELILGGGDAEYEGCPEQLIVNHMFDLVIDPIIDPQLQQFNWDATASGGIFLEGAFVVSRLTMVPCTQDYLRQIPGSAVAQYLVYNEFEQRFSTSRSVDCKFERMLSLIDTTDPFRSIFSAGVAGTVVGQTRVRAVGHGLIGVALEARGSVLTQASLAGGLTSGKRLAELPQWNYLIVRGAEQSDFNIHQQGDRAESDIITLP